MTLRNRISPNNQRLVVVRRNNRKGFGVPPAVPRGVPGNWLMGGMPPSLPVKMNFRQFSTGTITAGAIQTRSYSCNSIFTPSVTIDTTHRPLYYSTYSGLYTYYNVVQSEIRVTLTNTAVTADGVILVLSWDSDTTVSTNVDVLAALETAKSSIVGASGGTSVSRRLTHMFTPRKYMDVDYDNAANGAVFGNNPGDQFYWTVSANTAGASNGTFALDVEIDYYVVLSETISVSS